MVDSENSIKYSAIYKTVDFVAMTVSNINEEVYIAGNDFIDSTMFFSLYKINKLGKVSQILNKEPMPIRPSFVTGDENSLKVYGVLVGINMRVIAVGVYDINLTQTSDIKLSSHVDITTEEYPLYLEEQNNVHFIIQNTKVDLLSLHNKKHQLLQTDINIDLLYPSLFQLNNKKYIFYILNKDNRYQSIIKKLK